MSQTQEPHQSHQPLSVSFNEAVNRIGVTHDKLAELIKEGILETVQVAGSQTVTTQSLEAYKTQHQH